MTGISTLSTPAERRTFLEAHYGCPGRGALAPRERVLTALDHKEPDRVPFDFWAVVPVYESLRGYLGVDTNEQVLRLLGVDCRHVEPDYRGPAPVVQPDGTCIDEWGAHRRRVSNRFSSYDEFVDFPLAEAQTAADVEMWSGWPNLEDWDTRSLKSKILALNREVPYHIHYELGALFESAWTVYGLEHFLTDMILAPEVPCALMNCVTDLFITQANRVLEAAEGMIDAVYTMDDIGTQHALYMSPEMWRTFILPYHRRLNAAIRRYPVKIIYHSCGAIYPLIPAFRDEQGIDILDPLQPRAEGMDHRRIKQEFGSTLSFHGGVDIQRVLPYGSIEQVQAYVQERCRILGRGGGYICTSAHYLQSDVPLQNIVAMYTARRELR